MVKATCNLLMFDKPDKCGYLFSNTCKITFPEKIPVTFPDWNQEAVGYASIKRTENSLEAKVIFFPSEEETMKEVICGTDVFAAGYYIDVKSHEEKNLRVIDSMRVRSMNISFGDIYGDKSLKIELEEDSTEVIHLKPCLYCSENAAAIKTKELSDGQCHYKVKYVECENCGTRTIERTCGGYHGGYCTDEEIAKLWNRRVGDKED